MTVKAHHYMLINELSA